MKGDDVAVAVVGDCVNPGANMLVESVIGTVSERKKKIEINKYKTSLRNHKKT